MLFNDTNHRISFLGHICPGWHCKYCTFRPVPHTMFVFKTSNTTALLHHTTLSGVTAAFFNLQPSTTLFYSPRCCTRNWRKSFSLLVFLFQMSLANLQVCLKSVWLSDCSCRLSCPVGFLFKDVAVSPVLSNITDSKDGHDYKTKNQILYVIKRSYPLASCIQWQWSNFK